MRRIVSAAILINDQIVLGKRHCDCFLKMFELGLPKFGAVQGFVDQDGVFVDRVEACVIAKAADQIIKKHGPSDVLFSEDIY